MQELLDAPKGTIILFTEPENAKALTGTYHQEHPGEKKRINQTQLLWQLPAFKGRSEWFASGLTLTGEAKTFPCSPRNKATLAALTLEHLVEAYEKCGGMLIYPTVVPEPKP